MLSKQTIESDNVSMKSSSEDDELKRAEEFKGKGNEFFKSKLHNALNHPS